MSLPSTVDAFVEIVVKSGVLDRDVLDPYLQQMQTAGDLPDGPKKIGAALVRDGLLTPFQVNQFLQGKWRGFWISGKYKLLDHLGAGGMGSVFLCQHRSMRRRVAIKVLPAEQAKDPAALERFYREARAAAALDHPNIVRAHDIDHDGKYHFLVLEYVEGASLQEIVKRGGPMDVTRASHYIRQAALGLHHAHLAGLVHRDIKPANLLLDRQGVLKILDMGLARFFHDTDDNLTQKHDERHILGTADYLAPEQAINSHSVDIRADIYSLGATFYFLLVGQPPFAEGTVAQKLVSHQMRNPAPIRERRPDAPEGLVDIVSKMMAKDLPSRYQTPAEVYEALAPWTQTPIPPPPDEEMPQSGVRLPSGAVSDTRLAAASTPTLSTTPWLNITPAPVFPSAEATSSQLSAVAPSASASPAKGKSAGRRRNLIIWGAAAAVAAVVGALGSWMIGHMLTASEGRAPEQPPPTLTTHVPPPPPEVSPPPTDGVRHFKTSQYEAAVDADGRLTSLRSGGVEFLASAAGLPRGAYLAREGGRGALALTTVEQPAANVVAARCDQATLRYQFDADSLTCTAVNRTDEPLALFVVLAGATAALSDGRADVRKAPVAQEEWGAAAAFNGGRRLRLNGGTRVWATAGESNQIWYTCLAPHGTRTVVLEAGEASADEIARIAALNAPVVAAPPPASSNDLSFICVLSMNDLKERVVFSSPDRWDCPLWAPDGKSLLCSSKSKLHRLSLTGGAPEDFPTGALAPGRDYALSADGKQLGFTSGDAIYLVPAAGGEPTPILPKKQGYIHGWSPDGRTVVYTAGRKGPLAIFSRLADGGEETRLLTYAGFSDGPDFSPDGKWIYFCCDKSGKSSIWRMPAAGAGPDDALAQQITNDDCRDWFPHPSPDGKWLLFLSSRGTATGGVPDKQDVVLRLMPLPGDQPQSGPIREIARIVGGQGTINAPCWAPDGKSFAYVRYAPPR